MNKIITHFTSLSSCSYLLTNAYNLSILLSFSITFLDTSVISIVIISIIFLYYSSSPSSFDCSLFISFRKWLLLSLLSCIFPFPFFSFSFKKRIYASSILFSYNRISLFLVYYCWALAAAFTLVFRRFISS
jgi:hypothetical protein